MQYPDSVAMHLPGRSKVVEAKECPDDIDKYSAEMFRANQLPYMLKRLKTDKGNVLSKAITQTFEMGSTLLNLQEDLLAREGKLVMPEIDPAEVAKAQIEKVWFQNCAISKLREAQKAQDERRVMEHAKGLAEQELAARNLEVATLKEEKETLAVENAALREEQEKLAQQVVEMREALAAAASELEKESPEELAKRFLASRAFTDAAMMSCEDVIKFCLYKEIKKLGKIYPFTPEQIGFADIPPEKGRPKSLRGYGWDTTNDVLLKPDGEPLMGTYKISLQSHKGSGVIYTWPKAFPKDPTVHPTPVSISRPSRSEVGVGGSSRGGSSRADSARARSPRPKEADASKIVPTHEGEGPVEKG